MNVLIVSEYIAPLQAVASIRWTKIAKYLKKEHPEISITILTNEQNFSADSEFLKDPLLEKDLCYFNAYWQIPKSRELILYEKAKKRRLRSTRELQNKMQTLEKGGAALWAKKELLLFVRDVKERICLKQAIEFLAKHDLRCFDVIVSTYGPAWTHLVAEQIKRKNPDIFWIADFRDPYAKDTDGPIALHRHRQFVRKHCAHADVLTRVSESVYLNEHQGACVKTISNGFDPEEAKPSLPPNEFCLVFTGGLYGEKRDIGIVCSAVKDLVLEELVKDASVIYVGPDDALARDLAGRYGAQGYLRTLGRMPREKALGLQQRAAILLQLDWNTKENHCEWSGKMYEYMMARKPILFVVTGDEPNSYPSDNIDKLGGCCYEQCRHQDDYLKMKQYILDKYCEWTKTGDTTAQGDEQYIGQFSYEQIAKKIWLLINEKMKGRK